GAGTSAAPTCGGATGAGSGSRSCSSTSRRASSRRSSRRRSRGRWPGCSPALQRCWGTGARSSWGSSGAGRWSRPAGAPSSPSRRLAGQPVGEAELLRRRTGQLVAHGSDGAEALRDHLVVVDRLEVDLAREQEVVRAEGGEALEGRGEGVADGVLHEARLEV